MLKITCCRDCEQRKPGCHDHCEEYARQREALEAAKAVRKKDSQANGMEHERYERMHYVPPKGRR